MKSHFTLTLCMALCCLVLTGCPVTIKMAMSNHSAAEIFILYPTGYEALIKPGETKEVTYDEVGCLRIKSEGIIYEYQPVRLPNDYRNIRTFNTLIYTVFSEEKEFKAYIKNGNLGDGIKFNRGCP